MLPFHQLSLAIYCRSINDAMAQTHFCDIQHSSRVRTGENTSTDSRSEEPVSTEPHCWQGIDHSEHIIILERSDPGNVVTFV
jgi:hypothetical protein